MPDIIQFLAEIDGITKKKDKTLSVRLGSQELSPIDSAMLFDLYQKQIWVAFSDIPLKESDLNIPEVLTEFKTDKKPSQRLRDVLYRYWESYKKDSIDWDSYYRQTMEKFIQSVKEKLE